MRQLVGTIQRLDAAPRSYGIPGRKPGLPGAMANGGLGPFQASDVGKRVYSMGGFWQMENDDQRAARLGRFRWSVRGSEKQTGALGNPSAFVVEVEAATTVEACDLARAARYAADREHVHIAAAEPLLNPEA